MKLSKKLTPIALAVSMAMGGLVVPTMASAEVGYNATVASMYLWRGQDVSNGPTVSGGIDYSHDSGFYASTWVSSGAAATAGTAGGGYEIDFWVGYAGEAGGLGYDISYWNINYPQFADDEAIDEVSINLSYDAFSLGVVLGDDSYTYTTLGYGIGDFGFTYGMSDADGIEYSHFNISYAATDALSFTASFPSDDNAGIAEETLIMASYSLPL